MAEGISKGNRFLSKLSGKLAILVGSGLAVLSGASKLDAKATTPDLPTQTGVTTETLSASAARPLPPKLLLKQTASGYKMIAQHDSHSSHASHSSHSSHSSHASHSSHTSGGFV